MTALIIAGTSGGLLALTLLLFRAEAYADRRLVLSSLRDVFDRLALRFVRFFVALRPHVGSGAMRIAFLTITQRVLRRLLLLNVRVHERLELMRRRNKVLVHTARLSQAKSHLDLITEHKASMVLSDKQREGLKRTALEG